MTELFKQLTAANLRIKDLDRQIDGIDEHMYYIVNNLPLQRKIDKETLRIALYDQLSLKQVLLENIQIEINKELHLVSQNQRELTHLKSA